MKWYHTQVELTPKSSAYIRLRLPPSFPRRLEAIPVNGEV